MKKFSPRAPALPPAADMPPDEMTLSLRKKKRRITVGAGSAKKKK